MLKDIFMIKQANLVWKDEEINISLKKSIKELISKNKERNKKENERNTFPSEIHFCAFNVSSFSEM